MHKSLGMGGHTAWESGKVPGAEGDLDWGEACGHLSDPACVGPRTLRIQGAGMQVSLSLRDGSRDPWGR